MLTTEQAARLRGLVVRYGEARRQYGQGLGADAAINNNEWRRTVDAQDAAGRAVFDEIAALTEKTK